MLPPSPAQVNATISIEDAIENMPDYYNFIKYLKSDGYTFWDFKTYMLSDKSALPEKLMVIRHDIHHRDIVPGYYSNEIERNLIGKDVATYFVMFFYSDEFRDHVLQEDYLGFIDYLKEHEAETQAHVSPVDWFIAGNDFPWMDISQDELIELFNENYRIDHHAEGIDITVVGEDFMDIEYINSEMMRLIKKYKTRWFEYTGDSVNSFAAHGSAIKLNKVLQNSRLLDQRVLLDEHIYDYDTYNSSISQYLTYLSDNARPEWIKKPDQIEPGRYQLLMHPAVWLSDGSVYRLGDEQDDYEAGYCTDHVPDYYNGPALSP